MNLVVLTMVFKRRLIAAREQDAASRDLSTTTKIVYWEGYKGIDDAAKADKVTFTTLSIPEWFATLKDDPLDEVNKVWNEIGYKHFLEINGYGNPI